MPVTLSTISCRKHQTPLTVLLAFSSAYLAKTEMPENRRAGGTNVSTNLIIYVAIFVYLICFLHFRWKDILSTNKCKYRNLTILLFAAHTAMAAHTAKRAIPSFRVAGVNAPDNWQSWLAKKVAKEMLATATRDLEQTMQQFRPPPFYSSANDLSPATTLTVMAGALLCLLTSGRSGQNRARAGPPT